MQITLIFNRYSLSLDGSEILKDVSFKLETGDLLFLLGANGSGKSSLLKSIARLHSSFMESGDIILNGKPVAAWPRLELASLISYTAQEMGQVPPYTVAELARFGFYAAHKMKRDIRENEILSNSLELANITNLAEHQLACLSGGQRQKAYLASALAQQTPLLLLDEPDSFLDPASSLDLQKLILKLHSHYRKTLIIVSHNLSLPFQCDSKILLLKNGKKEYFGGSRELEHNLDILSETFGCKFHLLRHPVTNSPVIVP